MKTVSKLIGVLAGAVTTFALSHFPDGTGIAQTVSPKQQTTGQTEDTVTIPERPPSVTKFRGRYFCNTDGDCDITILRDLEIPEAKHPEIIERVRAHWAAARHQFVASGSSLELVEGTPLHLKGVPLARILALGKGLKNSLKDAADARQASILGALFEDRAAELFCKSYTLTYQPRPEHMLKDRWEPGSPCITAQSGDGRGRFGSWSVSLTELSRSLLAGLTATGEGKFLPVPEGSTFFFPGGRPKF